MQTAPATPLPPSPVPLPAAGTPPAPRPGAPVTQPPRLGGWCCWIFPAKPLPPPPSNAGRVSGLSAELEGTELPSPSITSWPPAWPQPRTLPKCRSTIQQLQPKQRGGKAPTLLQGHGTSFPRGWDPLRPQSPPSQSRGTAGSRRTRFPLCGTEQTPSSSHGTDVWGCSQPSIAPNPSGRAGKCLPKPLTIGQGQVKLQTNPGPRQLGHLGRKVASSPHPGSPTPAAPWLPREEVQAPSPAHCGERRG